jgi:multidrug efflux pump subunit AcrA (membrane-fusion protein)
VKVKTGKRNSSAIEILDGVKPGERISRVDPTRGEP